MKMKMRKEVKINKSTIFNSNNLGSRLQAKPAQNMTGSMELYLLPEISNCLCWKCHQHYRLDISVMIYLDFKVL